MSLKDLVDRLELALAVHALTGAGLARAGHMDRAVIGESIVVPLLQEMYKWTSLRNGNVDDPQTRGYDLIDDDAKIAVQVTIRADERQKVRESLGGFAISRPDARYRELYVLFLRTTWVDRRNLETIAVPDGLVFNPQKHIIEISDLARRAFGVEINKLAALVKNLEKSVGLLRRDQYNVDAVAISNDLVITLLKGIQPGHGDGFRRDAWQEAAALREDYQRATSVARLLGEARLASEEFVNLAGMAIEQVRIFTVTDCADRDQHHAAITAWKELRAAQLKLANYDQELPTIKLD